MFEFLIVMKGSLLTVVKMLQQDLEKTMVGKGENIPIQPHYTFNSTQVSTDQVTSYGHQIVVPSSKQMLFYMNMMNKEETSITGLQGFCQLRWDQPTANPLNEDWRAIFIPLFSRSAPDVALPSKVTNRKSTAGVSIQHIRMKSPLSPCLYSYIQHDWSGRPRWVKTEDFALAVDRILSFQQQVKILGDDPSPGAGVRLDSSYPLDHLGKIASYPEPVENFNIQIPQFTRPIFTEAQIAHDNKRKPNNKVNHLDLEDRKNKLLEKVQFHRNRANFYLTNPQGNNDALSLAQADNLEADKFQLEAEDIKRQLSLLLASSQPPSRKGIPAQTCLQATQDMLVLVVVLMTASPTLGQSIPLFYLLFIPRTMKAILVAMFVLVTLCRRPAKEDSLFTPTAMACQAILL